MATRFRLGLFDENCPYNKLNYFSSDTDAHNRQAYHAATRSITLLKNEGILPLKLEELKTIAVIGPNADSKAALEGNYNGISSRYVTFLEGIREACEGKARLMYARGSQLFLDRDSPITERDNRLREAVAIAKRADVVILCLGLDATLEGEQTDTGNSFVSGDKPDLELPSAQRRLLEAVVKTGKPVVTVIASGSALRVEDGNAIIWAGYPGQAGGKALADILFGKISPSGRLPVTFYQSDKDLPEFTDYSMKNRTYRYFKGIPLYPFGYGLSYTHFSYSSAVYKDGAVEVDVSNAGGMDGEEVAQVYVKNHHPDSPDNPVLCGFQRFYLKAGEKQRIHLSLSEHAFSVVNQQGKTIPNQGEKTLYIGGSQPDHKSAQLTGQKPLTLRI